MEEQLSPDKVSPIVCWLGSDEARDVTGRTFLAHGNTVQLLSWQSHTLAQRDSKEGAWDPSELGKSVLEHFEAWPKGPQPTPREF